MQCTHHPAAAHLWTAVVQIAKVGGACHWWVYPHSTQWWHIFAQHGWEDEKWLCNFRMMQGTFRWLVDNLHRRLVWQATAMWEPTGVDKRITIAIWWMTNTNCYQQVRDQFNHSWSTVAEIIVKVCLTSKLLNWTVCLGPSSHVSDMYGRMDGGGKRGEGKARQASIFTNVCCPITRRWWMGLQPSDSHTVWVHWMACTCPSGRQPTREAQFINRKGFHWHSEHIQEWMVSFVAKTWWKVSLQRWYFYHSILKRLSWT